MVDQDLVDEWEAWKAMCRVLRTLGVEINNEDELAEAIKRWGDELETLRQKQKEMGISVAHMGREESQHG